MKTQFRNVMFALLSLLLISCTGSGSSPGSGSSLDSRMIGTWVADRITADQDAANDQSTVILKSDGTGKIVTPERVANIRWQAKEGQLTAVNTANATASMMTYVFGTSADQVVLTMAINGKPVTQNYHKVIENYPANLIGNWSCFSLVVNGKTKATAALPDLQLQAGGAGSVLWSVSSDGAFVWRDPSTELGGVSRYEFQNAYLVMTDDNDSVFMKAKYYNKQPDLPPPPVNAASSYPCSVRQGFNFEKDAQVLVGHIDYLKIGETVIQSDFNVTDPENMSRMKTVAGVVSQISWNGGYADPLQFSAQVSTTNRNTLATLTHKSLSNTDVEFSFTVYDYDPKANKYYKCFHTDSTKLKGLIQKSGGELVMYIDMDQSMEVVSPKNYNFSLGVMPQDLTQAINMAISVNDKFVKKWGVAVSQ